MQPNHAADTERPRRKVLIVDEHPVVRAGLASVVNREPDLVVCGEAGSEGAALDAVTRLVPDFVILEWMLGNEDSTELIRALRTRHPQMPLLVFSARDEVLLARPALEAGASGFVMKREDPSVLVTAIRCLLAGSCHLSERALPWVPAGVRAKAAQALAARPAASPTVEDLAMLLPPGLVP